MLKSRLIACAIVLMACAAPAAAQEKVILDSDYTTIGDDGQVGVMAMQLYAAGKIDLLGITVVAGNGWLQQGVAEALRAVERMGMGGVDLLTRPVAVRLRRTNESVR